MQEQASQRVVASVPETLEKRLLVGFAIALTVLTVIVVEAVRNSLRLVESGDWVNHTHAVILEADAIVSSLNAAESAHRAFLITGAARDQADYRAAYADMLEHLEVAKALTTDNPRQQTQFKSLEPLVQRRLDAAKATTQARQQRGLDAARQLLEADTGTVELKQIRDLVSRLKQEENTLLQERDHESREQARLTRWLLFVGLGLDFVLLGFLLWLVRADLAVRRAAAATVQIQNELLEVKVQERTAELAASNESLQIENLERQWANEAVSRLHRHNELIISALDEAVFVVSRRGNIIRANPAATRLSGLEPGDLVGRALNELLLPTSQESAVVAWASHPVWLATKEGHDLSRASGSVLLKDGSKTVVRYSSHPVRDQDKVVGAIVTVVDLSPRASAEGPA